MNRPAIHTGHLLTLACAITWSLLLGLPARAETNAPVSWPAVVIESAGYMGDRGAASLNGHIIRYGEEFNGVKLLKVYGDIVELEYRGQIRRGRVSDFLDGVMSTNYWPVPKEVVYDADGPITMNLVKTEMRTILDMCQRLAGIELIFSSSGFPRSAIDMSVTNCPVSVALAECIEKTGCSAVNWHGLLIIDGDKLGFPTNQPQEMVVSEASPEPAIKVLLNNQSISEAVALVAAIADLDVQVPDVKKHVTAYYLSKGANPRILMAALLTIGGVPTQPDSIKSRNQPGR